MANCQRLVEKAEEMYVLALTEYNGNETYALALAIKSMTEATEISIKEMDAKVGFLGKKKGSEHAIGNLVGAIVLCAQHFHKTGTEIE